jgi:hypothetical protein
MFRTTLYLTVLCAAAPFAHGQPTDLLLGHYDVLIEYNPVPGDPDAGWRFSVAYDEDGDYTDAVGQVPILPDAVRLIAAPATRVTITSGTFLGTSGDIWVLPQNNFSDRLFLGFRSIMPPETFQLIDNGVPFPDPQGDFVLELVGISGSAPALGGNFAAWETNSQGQLEFHFDTSDGIGPQDRLESIPTGGHTHYSWGLTGPGTYHVAFRAYGWINPWQPNGGQFTQGFATYTFVVPFSCQAEGSADLHLAGPVSFPAAVHRADEQCEYAPDRIALVTEATDEDGTPVPYGFRLQTVADADAAPNRVGIDGTEAVTLPAGFGFRSPPLELVDLQGPGNATLGETAPGEVLLAFDEPGIYRLTLRALLENASAQPVEGDPFTLCVLAGLPVDYEYAAYADSFERQHGLPAGALADPLADFDADTIPNGTEFQLFWHGFDPVVPDARLLPLPSFENGSWGVTFLRDTYKDDFTGSGTKLSAAYSPALQTWTRWHTQSNILNRPFDPAFESGTGAASPGRVMERRVQADPADAAGFNRFEVF